MKPFRVLGPVVCAVIATFTFHSTRAADANPAPPTITVDKTTNGVPRLVFPYPAAQQYNVFSSGNVTNPLGPDANSGRLSGPTFIVTNGGAMRFYKVGVTPMSSNDIFAANVLNKLMYGPTPDDIDHIRAAGPQAVVNELMQWEAVNETIDTDPPITNTAPPVPPPNPLTNWIRVVATGASATGGSFLGAYLSGAGSIYIDNIWLCAGTNAETGTNLIVNGDFETTPLNPPWTNGSTIKFAIVTNSPTVDGLAPSGTNCLLLIASGATTTLNQGFIQQFTTNNTSATNKYTLSFYYLPVQNTNQLTFTMRLTGGVSGVATGAVVLPTLPPRPPTPPPAPPAINVAYGKLVNTNSDLDDFRAWHVYRAIHSKRQLHEVLAQFFQNHFTTQYQKTRDYFDNNYQVSSYTNDNIREAISVDLHWREHKKFRDALMNPNCTFYDLLKISIESEAMIIYLDTQLNSKAAPNQNYAREIMELHTMGADNGYIQQDIVDLSKVWTGWRVAKKDPANMNSPFAPAISGGTTNIVDSPGAWVLHFSTNNHDTTTKRLFTNSPVAARFGPAFGGGTSYALFLSNTLATGTNGFGEGYKVAQHLANLPYTMEFVSVKLCRVFVHDGFDFGVYNYTQPNLTPEAQLIKDCMTAWNTAAGDGRKGNVRSVLNTIFNSALFRGHAGSQQKVKTPIEYTVSAVRALRTVNTDTNTYFGTPLNYVTSTCDSDGYGISGKNGNTYPLSRMGGMGLFNKPEPDGWSEFGRIWLNTANLCERMRFAQHLLMSSANSLKSSDYGSAGLANTSDPVALLKARLPAASWNNDAAVVDFFLGLLYPGEGAANLGRDREAAISFLNQDEWGRTNQANSAFSSVSGSAYDGRVRSVVGFLMSLPRFQEQ